MTLVRCKMLMARRGPSLMVVSVVLAALGLTGCSLASPGATPASLAAPARAVLPNGVRLIIKEHSASDVVALHLWVGVGARDEIPSERGFSHFVEHLLFKGTDNLGPSFVDRDVEAVGGRTNAGTSFDYTFYYLLLPASRAGRGIEVLAEMAFNSTFDPAEITREREVIFEEARRQEDNPRVLLVRRLYQLMFARHPYGFPVLGDPEALRAATRETLRDYYQRHYVPENMTVVVVGAVDPDAVRAHVQHAFGAVPARGYRRQAPPPQPALSGIPQVILRRPERQAYMGLGWAGPRLGHADMYAVDLLAHILGGARSSRLNQALRERARLVSSIRAGYGALQRGGLVSVISEFEPDALHNVEAAILAEIKRIQDDGVTEEERERAVTAAESQHAFSTETAEGLAAAYGRAETVWTLNDELGYIERVRGVTRVQIQQAASRYLIEARARLVLLPERTQK